MIILDVLNAVLVGVLQGLIEWLPISSSGQCTFTLIQMMGITPQTAFSFAVWLHLGAAFAVIIRFRTIFLEVVKTLTRPKNAPVTQFLIIATVATAITAVPLYFFVTIAFRGWTGDIVMGLVGALLILTGLVLWVSKKEVVGRRTNEINLVDSLLGGLVQGTTILPGLSRSGLTIATFLGLGYSEESAVKLSFLMAVPAIFAAVIFDLLFFGVPKVGGLGLIFGLSTAFLTALIGIEFMLGLARKIDFAKFCITLGVIVVTYSLLLLG